LCSPWSAIPSAAGLVASLARPGGNVTGYTIFESAMASKWLELLKEIVPSVTRVAIMFNPATAAGRGEYFIRPIGRSIEEVAGFLCRSGTVEEVKRKAEELGLLRSK
jgi:hypothetical protein